MDYLNVLDKHYKAFVEIKHTDSFFTEFKEYLKYIYLIPELRKSIQDLDSETKKQSDLSPIIETYKVLRKGWDTNKDTSEEAFRVLSTMYVEMEAYETEEEVKWIEFEPYRLRMFFDRFNNKIMTKAITQTQQTKKVKNEDPDPISKEEIKLKTLGITIVGNSIYRRDKKSKKVFNPTETELIYYLHSIFIKNKNGRVPIDVLEKELEKNKSYIKNRITEINKILGRIISKVGLKRIILIKNDRVHGYYLDPKLFI